MEWKLVGNVKQVVTTVVLLGLVGLGAFFKPVSNIHLVVTFALLALHIYSAYMWNEGKATNKINPSKLLLGAYIFTAITAFACGWWFTGILWLFMIMIYIAIQSPKEKEKEIQHENA